MTAALPLPVARRRTILNGESLINDASGLVAFKFAVAAVATGAFSLRRAGGAARAAGRRWASLRGSAVAGCDRRHCRVGLMRVCVDDPTIQTHAVAADAVRRVPRRGASLHASGILAVVAAGLYARLRTTRSTCRRRRASTRGKCGECCCTCSTASSFLLLGGEAAAAIRDARAASHGATLGGLRARAVGHRHDGAPRSGSIRATYLPLLLFAAHPRARRRGAIRARCSSSGGPGLRGSVTMAAALSMPLLTRRRRAVSRAAT